MSESTLIKTINILLLFASVSMFYGLLSFFAFHFEEPDKKGFQTRVFGVDPQGQPITEPIEPPIGLVEYYRRQNAFWDGMSDYVYQVPHYEFIGYYFVTAYCPAECGYNGSNYPTGWTTSSGAICHYSDKWNEPTTCAIDRSYHGFNEILCVGDPNDIGGHKLYITEDTGSAVKGAWIDCFVESMDEVRTWKTGYYPVYRVTYEEGITTSDEIRSEYEQRIIGNLCYWRDGDWVSVGNDFRNDYGFPNH